MDSFFDDPEGRAQLRRAGVVHRPGLADETLTALGPLLREEGIDVNHLDDTDLDTVNAALARATARHNMELFTPFGAQRRGALAVLQAVTIALAEGAEETARGQLAQVEPEPDGDDPAISHVIGVALGVLDDWFADPHHRPALTDLRLPRWDRRAKAAATDIAALAGKSRAFDSLGSLHRNHTGLAIFEGSAIVVAGAVAALARYHDIGLAEAAGRFLPAEVGPDRRPDRRPEQRPRAGSGAAFGLVDSGPAADSRPRPVTTSAADRPLIRKVARWARTHGEFGPDEVSGLKARLAELFVAARRRGLDLHRPDGTMELADELADEAADDDVGEDLEALHSYVHYRMATTGTTDWEAAHDAVEAALVEGSELPPPLRAALDDEAALPPGAREAAVARTRVVTAVAELLDWLGTGRACSPSGGVRRADIQHVAGLLGFSAVGVNKRPPLEPGDLDSLSTEQPELGTIYALSMQDVPPLEAWWSALQTAELIEVGSTRVWPGPAAHDWSGSHPDPATAELLIASFVATVVTRRRDVGPLAGLEEVEVVGTIAELMTALTPALVAEGLPLPAAAEFMRPRMLLRMSYLAQVGLLERDSAGDHSVPEALRGVLARALLLASSMLLPDEEPLEE